VLLDMAADSLSFYNDITALETAYCN
jgi:hypothetical protein